MRSDRRVRCNQLKAASRASQAESAAQHSRAQQTTDQKPPAKQLIDNDTRMQQYLLEHSREPQVPSALHHIMSWWHAVHDVHAVHAAGPATVLATRVVEFAGMR